MKLEQIPKSKDGCSFCALCGKSYIKQPGHMYKVKQSDKTYSLCSYTCWNAAKGGE